jgi:hypothetical protein
VLFGSVATLCGFVMGVSNLLGVLVFLAMFLYLGVGSFRSLSTYHSLVGIGMYVAQTWSVQFLEFSRGFDVSAFSRTGLGFLAFSYISDHVCMMHCVFVSQSAITMNHLMFFPDDQCYLAPTKCNFVSSNE